LGCGPEWGSSGTAGFAGLSGRVPRRLLPAGPPQGLRPFVLRIPRSPASRHHTAALSPTAGRRSRTANRGHRRTKIGIDSPTLDVSSMWRRDGDLRTLHRRWSAPSFSSDQQEAVMTRSFSSRIAPVRQHSYLTAARSRRHPVSTYGEAWRRRGAALAAGTSTTHFVSPNCPREHSKFIAVYFQNGSLQVTVSKTLRPSSSGIFGGGSSGRRVSDTVLGLHGQNPHKWRTALVRGTR